MAEPLADLLLTTLDSFGLELEQVLLAWARVAPSVVLIPAFGLRASPPPVRAALGLALATAIAPAVETALPVGLPVAIRLLAEVLRGLPTAIAAATMLWAAGMTGGLIDDLRGNRDRSGLPTVPQGSTPLAAVMGMLAAMAFLQTGGPSRVASALIRPPAAGDPVLALVGTLLSGVEVALSVAAPVLAVSVVVEVASALVTRAASPAYVQPLMAPVRQLAVLGAVTLLLDRMVATLMLAQLP